MNLPALIMDDTYSLTERVFYTLKQGILSFSIKPREYLIIGDIAKVYGISRTPVREAILILEREGWIENDGRRGARVTVPSAEIILETIEVQSALEGYIVRRVTDIVTDQDIHQLTLILNRAEHYITKGQPKKAHLSGTHFHQYLADKVGNRKLKAAIAQLQEHIDRVRPLIWQHAIIPVDISAQQHREILDAIQVRDVTKAEELMIYHTTWYEKKLAHVLAQY